MTLNRMLDRCDRCGVQAFVRVIHPETYADLLFCGHHYGEHELVLMAMGWSVEDERHLIEVS